MLSQFIGDQSLNLSRGMEIVEDPLPHEHRPGLTNLSRTCFIAPKATGIASLIVQFALLIISVLVSLVVFYHVGGHINMGLRDNSTTLSYPSKQLDSSAITTTMFPKFIPMNKHNELLNISVPELGDIDYDSNGVNLQNEQKNDTVDLLVFEQVPSTSVYVEILNAQLDMRELIQISTFVYFVLSILWLISISLLLLSIKFEILDMVSINAVFLTIALMYIFIHALFISLLLYYQRDLTWRTMAIFIGSVIILICTTLFGGISLALVIGWYKYIVYMNDSDKCLCLYGLIRLIKERKKTPTQASQEYAMPSATRHNDIPYADEPPINNFTSF